MVELIDRPAPSTPRLLEQVRLALHARSYSVRTQEIYVGWVVRYVRHFHHRHPREMAARHLQMFLDHLATDGRASASTRNQALSALLFLYRYVLQVSQPWLDEMAWARQPRPLPVVLSRDDVRLVLGGMSGVTGLMARLMYGSGLRLRECCRLRVLDLELERRLMTIRTERGTKDRQLPVPEVLVGLLRAQLSATVKLYRSPGADGGGVWSTLPPPLEKLHPRAGKTWGWQWVFSARRPWWNPSKGRWCRHHIHETSVQRAVKLAVRTSGIAKPASCQTLRHSYAVHLLEDGYDVRTVQALLGHRSVTTTLTYTEIVRQSPRGVRSPLDSSTFESLRLNE